MSKNYSLTIAIPTYNRQQYLADLLDLLVIQCRECNSTRDVVEIIVSDNASTDTTQEFVLRNYPNDVKYYRNDRNIGAAANYIECIKHATGQYIWLFGDDEIICENAVCQLLALIDKTPSLIITESSFNGMQVYKDYCALLRHVLPYDPVYPVHHTLITCNVFPKNNFDIAIATEKIHTDYGLTYAILTHMDAGSGVILLGGDNSLFKVRDVRAPFHWVPNKLEYKLIDLCAYLADLYGIKKLKYNIWLYYRAPRIFKLVHSKKLHRMLSYFRSRLNK